MSLCIDIGSGSVSNVNIIFRSCLNMMTHTLNTEHHVHWHCFSGKMEDFLAIKGAFHNTKFGISPFLLMPNKYPDFNVDLCELRLRDMILESDAPYLHPKDYPEASPMLLKVLWIYVLIFCYR